MANDPTVNIIASPSGARLQAPSTNNALQLASALSTFAPSLGTLVNTINEDQKQKQGEKAQRDALVTSGEAYGDAVREGKIEPTQNPWYIRQYKQATSAIQTQTAATNVLADSQTWQERNDPAAYAQRFHEEMGKIGQQFTDPDSLHAFNAVSAQVTQQALAQNTSYNVTRINAEHQQAMGGLTTTALLATSANNGGKASADQLYGSIEPIHQQYIKTGGTESDWNMLTINSVVAAAQNSGDASLLDILDDDRGGKGPLANISDPTGKPVASFLAQQRYDIERTVQSRGMSQIKAIKDQVALRGLQAVQDFWSSPLAPGFIQDQSSLPAITAYLGSKGYTPQEQQAALSELSKDATANASFVKNSMNDADGLQLFTEARTKGWSPKFDADLAERVRTNTMTKEQANSLTATAMTRSEHLESEGRADARQAKSDARAAAADSRRNLIEGTAALKQNREDNLGLVSSKLQALGDKSLLDPTAKSRVALGALQAEGAYRTTHPDDIKGQMDAADNYLNNYLTQRIARKAKPGVGSPGTGKNVRR